ncbi:YerC/YecD family TrpR-related protein [Desulfofundulus thermosubterraneus]|uniref:Trp operon repressor family n=1 Tax=Desulfofundulus thermosubterraneus DSM 16057 TaxID=1121432 RepID=A0A1M6IV32_9FIRM|nr:YerC/YecD family TrpR-related protein [Desulfofundulus thermosubterraneus]SHJ38258.1 Trp operon repressor family [Desulfofundulus thermosubterraneus DSM 16057]
MAYTGKLKDPLLDELFEAVLTLRDIDECYQFFEDICTVAELKAMAQRLAVAKMLQENRTYTEIAAQTGASTATISRVKRCLNYGADGYKLVLARLAGKAKSAQ